MQGPIRYFTLPMLLVMWGGVYWLWSSDLLIAPLLIGIIGTHLICTIIFYRFMYAFNFGYASTMILLPLIYAAIYSPGFAASVFLAVVILYGLRLGLFSWRRYMSESYAARAQESTKATRAIPFPLVIITWLFLSALMFFITFNAWAVASRGNVNATIWLSTLVMLIGLSIEAIADRQKQDVKRIDKDTFCYIGLYKKIRHPNYLGEIIFHMGLYWGMVSSSGQIHALILGGLGTGWILAMMCSEAFVLDQKQLERYGELEKFNEYRKTSGLLLPRLF